MKRQATKCEKILAKHISDKDWYPKYTKNSQNLTVRKQTSKKWAKDLNICLTKEDVHMANMFMRKCSTSLVREMTTEITRYQYAPIRMAEIIF